MIPVDFLEMLRCPQSGQPLGLAGTDVLKLLNDRISRGSPAGQGVCNLAGMAVEQPMEEALLRGDRLLLYPIRDGIPVLLADEAIRL